MSSLVKQLMYVDPLVSVPAIRLGRQKEPLVVERYVEAMREEESLVDVTETDLHAHPTFGFLAASPDRLVDDPSCQPCEGLPEVKFLASVVGPPEDALSKATICMEKGADGVVRLKRTHNYYYQVQGQMACTGHSWCDFACMSSSGQLFKEPNSHFRF